MAHTRRAAGSPLLVLVTSALLFLLTGCGGPMPDFPLDGDLSREQVEWIEGRMKERGKERTGEGLLGRRVSCVPPVWLRGRNLYLSRGHEDTGYWSSHAGPYYYGEASMYFLPFPLTWYYTIRQASHDFDGHHLWNTRHRFFLAGLLGGCGDFKHRHERTVPGLRGGSCILFSPIVPLLLVTLPEVLPARWYFNGKEGSYWQVLLGTLGHISTDRSRTMVLLGLVPIKYWRGGPEPGPGSQ